MDGFQSNINLNTLILSHNRIDNIENLDNL
jgi:hypothetical protein